MLEVIIPNPPIFKIDVIQCPECYLIQAGKVEYTEPFPSYFRKRHTRGYLITESEWNVIIDNVHNNFQSKGSNR